MILDCKTHNFKWFSGEGGIIVYKCEICGEKIAIVKIKEYVKFDLGKL